MRYSIKDIMVLLGFIFLCLLTGMISSYFMTDGLQNWYPSLIKSPLSPPDWLFAPVWTALYILMGAAVWMMWREREKQQNTFPIAMTMFLVQLFLNGAWTFCFFYLQNPALGLAEIIGLDLALVLTAFVFFKMSRAAGILLFPYALWLAFATYLNGYIVWAN